MLDIPHFCVLVGANGSGKSTLFQVFAFLKEALMSNVRTALIKLGGSMGFREVRSRKCKGNIEIEVKFREHSNAPLVTYFLSIGERNGDPFVKREILRNGDELTSPSRRTDLDQVCSIYNHKS